MLLCCLWENEGQRLAGTNGREINFHAFYKNRISHSISRRIGRIFKRLTCIYLKAFTNMAAYFQFVNFLAIRENYQRHWNKSRNYF